MHQHLICTLLPVLCICTTMFFQSNLRVACEASIYIFPIVMLPAFNGYCTTLSLGHQDLISESSSLYFAFGNPNPSIQEYYQPSHQTLLLFLFRSDTIYLILIYSHIWLSVHYSSLQLSEVCPEMNLIIKINFNFYGCI